MEPEVIFEDSYILVLEKPANMVVTDAKTVRGLTVQKWLEEKLKCQNSNVKTTTQKSKLSDFYQRAGIVHRLDKETSGLLLVAKTPAAFADLQQQFKERKVEKKYLALVHGKVEPSKGEIRVPVGRLGWDRKRFGVKVEGKEAESEYQVIGSVGGDGKWDLLEVSPKTGRTHQIRVHLKYFGYPIVADLKYGGKRAKKDRQWCPRMFLHASYLGFTHPKTGKWLEFESGLPKDLRGVMENLGSARSELR